MPNSNIANLGRFSSQMLTYLGTQRTVTIQNGYPTNTFKYANGPTTYPSPGSISQSALGAGVVGNYSPEIFNSTTSYFLSRGVGSLYADTMTALAIDMAAMSGVNPQAMLEQAEFNSKVIFTDNAYRAFNNLRDPGNQVSTVTTVDNKFSLQSSQIRS